MECYDKWEDFHTLKMWALTSNWNFWTVASALQSLFICFLKAGPWMAKGNKLTSEDHFKGRLNYKLCLYKVNILTWVINTENYQKKSALEKTFLMPSLPIVQSFNTMETASVFHTPKNKLGKHYARCLKAYETYPTKKFFTILRISAALF